MVSQTLKVNLESPFCWGTVPDSISEALVVPDIINQEHVFPLRILQINFQSQHCINGHNASGSYLGEIRVPS